MVLSQHLGRMTMHPQASKWHRHIRHPMATNASWTGEQLWPYGPESLMVAPLGRRITSAGNLHLILPGRPTAAISHSLLSPTPAAINVSQSRPRTCSPCKSCRFDIRSAAHTAFHLGTVSFTGNQPEIAPPSANPYPPAPEVRLLACTRHPNVPPNHGRCILSGAPRLAIRKSFCEFGTRSFPLNRDMGFRVNSNSPLWSRDWRKPSGS